MSENNDSNFKIVLPSIVLFVSLKYSIMLTVGIVIGYIISKLFYDILVEKGKIDSVFVDFGKWKFHFHHWIMGVILLAVIWILYYFYIPAFLAGFILGVILHDIYDFNDWYKVILRNYDDEGKIA